MIFSGWNFSNLKMGLFVVFLWLASPVSSHLLAMLEVATNDNLEAHCTVYPELKTLENELAAAKSEGSVIQQGHLSDDVISTGGDTK